MRHSVSLIASCLVGLLLTVAGCSGPPASAKVRGKVMLDGEPVSGAQVQLVPKDKPALATHTTTTGTDGTFTIQPTSSADRPVEEGKYQAVITKTGPPPGSKAGEMATVNLLPPQYGDRTKTPLTVDVKSGDNNLEPFALTAKK